ncbi:hypothetical protein KAV46_05025 [Candidatus Bathyarchaeota archaeon]|nr:hypothetical protein [Candidatus Bathyarchaeota archaeon]MCK4438685.1 hypothetical protein [Candidatus Bathyarchaeota archaeon]
MGSVASFIEERRRELHRLMEGALLHVGVREYDVGVTKRRGVDIYDPDKALFVVKADTLVEVDDEMLEFIRLNFRNRGYEVKRVQREGLRLLLLI